MAAGVGAAGREVRRAVAGVGGSGAVGGGGLGLEAGDGGGGLAECGGVRVARGHRPLAVFAEVQAFRAETVAAFAGVWATQAEHSRRLGDLGVAVSLRCRRGRGRRWRRARSGRGSMRWRRGWRWSRGGLAGGGRWGGAGPGRVE